MDESQLIDKILAGDKEAFDSFVIDYRERILIHCKEIVHDEEIANDLTQEAFIAAYQQLATFERRSSFYTWLWRIAHNLCLNYLKKEKKMHCEPLQDFQKPCFQPEDYHELLALLPEKQRIVFELYFIERMAQKDIALKLKIPPGTVRSRIHYAKKKLAKLRL